jgi:hypothetical protein
MASTALVPACQYLRMSKEHQRYSLENQASAITQDRVRSGVAEDRFTGAIESQTSKIPSSGYLAAAFGGMAASAILKLLGKDDWCCLSASSLLRVNSRSCLVSPATVSAGWHAAQSCSVRRSSFGRSSA